MGQGGTRYFTLSSNATESTLGTSTSTPMRFVANDIESFRIAPSTRNLLINTSTDNGNKFQINGNSSINGGWRYLDFIGATTNFWDCYHYNDNTFRMNYNGSGGDEFVLFNNGNLEIGLGSIKTASPSGGAAQPFKSGSYVAGAVLATGYIQFEVNGVTYKLLAST
jgi:hypothetical protein